MNEFNRQTQETRVAFVLRTQERIAYGEVADASGVTLATARTQVMKARKALHGLMEPFLMERK